ncbi:MAG TPA: hypothetical protein VF029_00440 [Actinomycetota bacterium]
MEPLQYLRAFRRRWAVIVAAVAVAVATGWLTTETVAPAEPEPTRYQATAVLWNPSGVTVGTGASIPLTAMVRLATLPDVLVMAAEELDWQDDPLALRGRVSVQVDPVAEGFLNITSSADTPRDAERIAQGFADALIRYLQGLQTRQIRQQIRLVEERIATLKKEGGTPEQIAALQVSLQELAVRETVPVGLAVLQAPEAEAIPTAGFQPPQSRTLRLLIAAGIGLFAGLGLALVLERFDTKIRTRQAAEEHFGAPVLAEVPVLSRRHRRGVTVARRSTDAPADAFRLLAAGVASSVTDRARDDGADAHGSDEAHEGPEGHLGATVLVTSPGPSDGKTLVAANLAAALGEMGRRVLLISCDLRRPKIHRAYNVPVSPGLVDLLGSNGSGNGVSPYLTTVRNVALLPSGFAQQAPAELLASPAMGALLRRARRHADVVLLDTSPLLVGNDATAVLAESDAVVLVARANKTSAEIAERTKDVLERLEAPVVGIALNRAREINLPASYRRYYGRRLAAPPRRGRRWGFPRLSRHRNGT